MTMWWLPVGLCGLLLLPTDLHAEPPFSQIASPVEHVAKQVEKFHGRAGEKTIIHGREWTRVDVGGSAPLDTLHVRRRDALRVRFPQYGPGHRAVEISKGTDPERRWSGRDVEPIPTGERDKIDGETCEVWNIARTYLSPSRPPHSARHPGNANVTSFSCVTDDGIELWFESRSAYGVGWSRWTTHLQRRPVEAHEAAPPKDILNLNAWLATADQAIAPPSDATDFELVLETKSDARSKGSITRTIRRHYPWISTVEVSETGARSILITNAVNQLKIQYRDDGKGTFRTLLIHKTPGTTPLVHKPVPPERSDSTDVVLGETCRWFNSSRFLMDVSFRTCLTDDHVVLKDEAHGQGGFAQKLEAVRLRRGPVDLADVRPPTELLDPRTWGLLE